jgi:hypothetical protein
LWRISSEKPKMVVTEQHLETMRRIFPRGGMTGAQRYGERKYAQMARRRGF